MADAHVNGDGDGHPSSSVNSSRSQSGPAPPPNGPSEALLKDMDDVMLSDIGLATLLDRLKQSIASARDFATFLKKRSIMEDDHQKAMKRLVKSTEDSLQHVEARQGSYKRQMEEAMRTHSKMANNTNSFALSLSQMHEDLAQLTANMERGRKEWKHEGLSAEKKASDAESLMNRAKAKYDGLAEDYDRAKTGDVKGKAKFIKGPKSAAQYEEDVMRKLQIADNDYQEKVHLAKSQRDELVRFARPKAVKAVQDLIRECDSALTMQLQKYATFTEKLLIGNGLLITPLPNESASQRSLRDIMNEVNNDSDFQNHILSQKSKVPVRRGGIEYIKHPTLAPKPRVTHLDTKTPPAQQSFQAPIPQPEPSPQQRGSNEDRTYSLSQGPAPPSAQGPPHDQPHSRQTSQSAPYPSGPPGPPESRYLNELPYPSGGPPMSLGGPSPSGPPINMGGPPPPGAPGTFGSPPRSGPFHQGPPTGPPQGPPTQMPYHNGPPPPSQNGLPIVLPPVGGMSKPPPSGPPPNNSLPPPTRPIFGVALEELFMRDGSAVPMVVYQCIQAVDLFGLNVEGIYRQNGTAQHIVNLKAQFDNDATKVDFRDPASFHHDVNSVAGLLKQFFRDLPDPLLTKERYSELISAARIEDDIVRRDTMHAIINGMPDANYATLRVLVLHLNRVQEHQSQNRMSSQNLAICFAPSLMGVSGGAQIQDSGLQARVIDTILVNTFSIFDED